jgi:hypothetical protein
MHLPKKDSITLHFIQQVLRGEKKLFGADSMVQIDIPLWEELGVKKQWVNALQIPGFIDYIPDEWVDGHRADREYFWSILFNVNGAFTRSLIEDCQEQRLSRASIKKVGPNLTEILPDFLEMLVNIPFNTRGKSWTPSC